MIVDTCSVYSVDNVSCVFVNGNLNSAFLITKFASLSVKQFNFQLGVLILLYFCKSSWIVEINFDNFEICE